jgi:hypothetical protein
LIRMFAHWRTRNCKAGAFAQLPLSCAAYQKPRAPSVILGLLPT